ncbi:MAG: DUF2878 domain-containing protein [Sedimentisphaerales bacterium]|nr:DUF2878 domain-containing protein [Sedimentisphaerales bacterium]
MKLDKMVLTPWIGGIAKNVWNIISIELGWLLCILGAAWGHYWLGLVAVPILLVIHITVIERHKIYTVFMVALMTMIIGFFADTLLIILGTIKPNRWLMPAPLTTLWDLMIWVNFSLALDTSLRFLQKRPLAAAFLGALFAPGTYYAGDRLGALRFSEPHFGGLLWIGIVWIFVMPCLALMARYFYHTPKKYSVSK